MFIETTGGAKTPEAIAKSLKKNGHLIASIKDPSLNGRRKYYKIKESGADRIIEVLIIEEKAISTRILTTKQEATWNSKDATDAAKR